MTDYTTMQKLIDLYGPPPKTIKEAEQLGYRKVTDPEYKAQYGDLLVYVYDDVIEWVFDVVDTKVKWFSSCNFIYAKPITTAKGNKIITTER